MGQVVAAAQAEITRLEVELQAKLEAQRSLWTEEQAAADRELESLVDEHSDEAVRRRQKLVSELAIERGECTRR